MLKFQLAEVRLKSGVASDLCEPRIHLDPDDLRIIHSKRLIEVAKSRRLFKTPLRHQASRSVGAVGIRRRGIQLERAEKLALGSSPIPCLEPEHEAECRVRFRGPVINRDRLLCGCPGLRPSLVCGLQLSGAIVNALKLKLGMARSGSLGPRYTNSLDAYNLYLKGRYHWNLYSADGLRKTIGYSEQALCIESCGDVFQLAFVGLRPEVVAIHCIDELRSHSQTVAGPANGTLDDDSDPEFSPDLPDIERLAFVLEHHAAGSHPESLHLREAVNELLCQAIAEVLAGWVRTEI